MFKHPSYANLRTVNDIIEEYLAIMVLMPNLNPTQEKNLKLSHPRKRKSKLLKNWLKMTKMIVTTTVLPVMMRKVCQ